MVSYGMFIKKDDHLIIPLKNALLHPHISKSRGDENPEYFGLVGHFYPFPF